MAAGHVLVSVTSGWTDDLGPFTLRTDGVPLDLTGMTVTLLLHDPTGALVTPGGVLTVDPNQVTKPGQVSYKPIATDFVFIDALPYAQYQPYTLHFKVVDGGGDIVFFPNAHADQINVYKQ